MEKKTNPSYETERKEQERNFNRNPDSGGVRRSSSGDQQTTLNQSGVQEGGKGTKPRTESSPR